MTKGELINAVAKAAKTSKRAAENAVNTTFESLARAIKKTKRVQVAGFGTFFSEIKKSKKGTKSSNWRRARISRRVEQWDSSQPRI